MLMALARARMGKVHSIGKTIITVYANDHLPPHFHIGIQILRH